MGADDEQVRRALADLPVSVVRTSPFLRTAFAAVAVFFVAAAVRAPLDDEPTRWWEWLALLLLGGPAVLGAQQAWRLRVRVTPEGVQTAGALAGVRAVRWEQLTGVRVRQADSALRPRPDWLAVTVRLQRATDGGRRPGLVLSTLLLDLRPVLEGVRRLLEVRPEVADRASLELLPQAIAALDREARGRR